MYANGVFWASNAYFKGVLVEFSVVCSTVVYTRILRSAFHCSVLSPPATARISLGRPADTEDDDESDHREPPHS